MATIKQPTTASCQPFNACIVQNFHLVWLHDSIDENNNEWRNFITKLRDIVNTVTTFIDVDRCIDFITDINETAFMVVSGEFSETLIPIVQNIAQLSYVYIFCENKWRYEEWVKEYPNVSGIYADIPLLCDALKQASEDCDHNAVSISFVKKIDGAANQSVDTLDCSFMYTQILKEILLAIDFNQEHTREFLTYCREQLADNSAELRNVEKIDKEYDDKQAIWWYTYQCFLYSMVNRALRTMEVDLIVKMGFFVRDLHKHITALHSQQYDGENRLNSFVVYRGQGLSQTDFDQMKTTHGGLFAFNSFLSTSLHRDVSLRFARRIINKSNLVGVLFLMTIDPSVSTTSFANIKDVSCYKREEEILFSMHSVFRIGSVQQIENNDRLWEVNLTLTSDNDPQLQALTKSMEKHTAGSTGWLRLGSFMITIAQFEKAQQLYEIMLNETADEGEKGYIYHQLASIKNEQGKQREAITYYENSLKTREKTLPANHPDLASSYNNIGSVYKEMGEYSKALLYHEKALEIFRKTRPANHPTLITSYNNIGLVYDNMGDYSKALSYYKKALEIRQKTLPANHPALATSYHNIGSLYYKTGEYSKALSYLKKALELREKTLPANHPDLANSYNNIGSVYDNMGEYSKAHSYYERAVEILQKTLPANHPYVATSYNNIGSLYYKTGEYSKVLSYYEKALEIQQRTLPANHPSLATSYNNIGLVYNNMGEYSKALSYCERALDILQRSLPSNHPHLKQVKKNMEIMKKKL